MRNALRNALRNDPRARKLPGRAAIPPHPCALNAALSRNFTPAPTTKSLPAAAVRAAQSLLAHLSSHLSADLLSTLDFDESGDYLATGDRGGRIVVFERSAVEKVRARRRRRSPTPTAFGAADGDRAAAPHHTHSG